MKYERIFPDASAIKLPRVQFTLWRLMGAIALTTVLTYLVVIPAWDYYHLPPKTRLILRKLRMPVSLPINGPMTLEEFLKAIKTASAGPKDSGIPLYVEPNGLSEVGATMPSTVTATTDRRPIEEQLERSLPAPGLGLNWVSACDIMMGSRFVILEVVD